MYSLKSELTGKHHCKSFSESMKKKNNNNMNRYLKAVLIGFVITFFCIVLSILSHPGIITYVPSEEVHSVLTEAYYVSVNGQLDEETLSFTPTSSDAQLYILGIDDALNTLTVTMETPLPKETMCQLFYSLDGKALSESASIKLYSADKETNFVFRLPQFARYEYFRLDIDRDYTIHDISTEIEYPEQMSYLYCILNKLVPFPVRQLFLILCIILTEVLLAAWKWERICSWFAQLKEKARNQNVSFKRALIFFTCSLFGSVLLWVFTQILIDNADWNKYSLFYFVAAGAAIGSLIVFHNQLGDHPERAFLAIGLCVGMIFVVLEPPSALLTWDDEIHFQNALFISYGGEQYYTSSEKAIIERTVGNTVNTENMSILCTLLNEGHKEGAEEYRGNSVSPEIFLSYLPMAAGLWLGRALFLPFSTTLAFGRAANLFCYLLVVFFASKQIKRGKMFVFMLGLIPTMLFMAGNYSYDPFCYAFILLGFCIWLGAYQDAKAKMTLSKTCLMLLSMVIGVSAKMIYFPLFLILFFLPSSKFESKQKRWTYYGIILTVMLFMALYMVYPFLIGSANAHTDTRGGSDVNGPEQLRYILTHPFEYAQLLMRFMFDSYLNIGWIMGSVGGCIRSFAYLSIGGIIFPENLAYLFFALMFVSFLITNKNETNADIVQPTMLTKSFSIIISFGTLCAVATAFYIAFTAVGANSIQGCQARYMLTVLAPLLIILRPSMYIHVGSEKKFNRTILGLYTMVMFCGLIPLLSRYL